MRRLRLWGFVSAISIMLMIVTPVTASALENPELLPNPTEAAPLKFTSKGGESNLNSVAGNVISKKLTNSGEFTSTRLGKISIDFLEAKSSGINCNSIGDEKGTILVANADAHLVDILPSGVLTLGLAVTPLSTVLIKCGTLSIAIKGTTIGQFDSVTSGAGIAAGAVTTVLFHATVKGGVSQLFKTCDLDKAFCEGKTYLLLTEFGTGYKEATEEATDEVSFSENVCVAF